MLKNNLILVRLICLLIRSLCFAEINWHTASSTAANQRSQINVRANIPPTAKWREFVGALMRMLELCRCKLHIVFFIVWVLCVNAKNTHTHTHTHTPHTHTHARKTNHWVIVVTYKWVTPTYQASLPKSLTGHPVAGLKPNQQSTQTRLCYYS